MFRWKGRVEMPRYYRGDRVRCGYSDGDKRDEVDIHHLSRVLVSVKYLTRFRRRSSVALDVA